MRSYASCANDNARYTTNQSAEKVIDKLKSKLKLGNEIIKSTTCAKLLGIKNR